MKSNFDKNKIVLNAKILKQLDDFAGNEPEEEVPESVENNPPDPLEDVEDELKKQIQAANDKAQPDAPEDPTPAPTAATTGAKGSAQVDDDAD